jgi:hypothetical protein
MILMEEENELNEHPGDQLTIKPKDPSLATSIFANKVEPMTEFQKKMCDFYVMRNMRKSFGDKHYNDEEVFPDPRIKRLCRKIYVSK